MCKLQTQLKSSLTCRKSVGYICKFCKLNRWAVVLHSTVEPLRGKAIRNALHSNRSTSKPLLFTYLITLYTETAQNVPTAHCMPQNRGCRHNKDRVQSSEWQHKRLKGGHKEQVNHKKMERVYAQSATKLRVVYLYSWRAVNLAEMKHSEAWFTIHVRFMANG